MKQHLLFWTFAVIITLSLCFLNIQSHQIIQNFFQEERFDVLNKIAFVDGNKSLGYYQGRIEDVLVGPITNVLSFLIFVGFALLYLKDTSTKNFCFWVFIFLCLSKFNVLFFPPYGDAIGGPFAEALWLAKHQFNYAQLYHELPYDLGGPRVYFFSIYPPLLAILLKIIPHTTTFLVVNHLLVFIMAAVVVALSRSIASRVINKQSASLSAILILAVPLFQSQTEAINMEMPSLFVSMIAIYYLSNKNIGRAALFSVLAAFIKGHATMICASVFLTAISLFMFDQERRGKKKDLLFGFIALLGALLQVSSKFLLNDQHVSAGMVKFLAGLPSLKIMIIPHLYIGSLLVFLIFFILQKNRWRDLFERYYVSLVIFITAGMWYLVFLNFYAVSPRYKLELTPFLVLCMIFAAVMLPGIKRIASIVLVMSILVAALASYGLFEHPDIPNYHIFSERSLEYRNDLRLNQQIVKIIENNYADYTIGAPFLMAQMLHFPELGYVKKPLDVVVYGMPVVYGNIKNFAGLEKMNIMKTVWIGWAAQFETKANLKFPIHDQDRILNELELGDNKATLFMGGIAIEQRRKILEYLTYKAAY